VSSPHPIRGTPTLRSPPSCSAGESEPLNSIWGLLRLAPAWTVAYGASAVVAAGASLVLPAAIANLTDRAIRGAAPGAAFVALAATLVVRVLAATAAALAQEASTAGVNAVLRTRLLRHVFALGMPGLRRYAAGDLLSRLLGDTAQSARAVPVVLDAVLVMVTSLSSVALLWSVDWRMGAAFVLCASTIYLPLRRAARRVSNPHGDYQRQLGAIAARLIDSVAGGRTIQAAGTERREIGRVLAPLTGLGQAGDATWSAQRAVSWQLDLAVAGVQVIVLGVAGLSVAAGRISPGEFLAGSLYLAFALGSFQLADHLIALGQARACLIRVDEVLADEPQRWLDTTVSRHPGPGAVSVRGVSVRIADRVVLDQVDLEIPPGLAVAVVGPSGTGKSTLALLVGRHLEPDQGEVLIDGVPVAALGQAGLRRHVAYAFDRPLLMGNTVAEAIAFGRPAATPAEVEEAADLAGAKEFIRMLPDGFGTVLSEAFFSGGELQRLGLARAVVQDARILVLDDATSSLDTVTEARVTEALTRGLRGRTRLVIAHRASTAARSDLVAWLDEGRIRAVATHRELWATEPAYREVFGDRQEQSGQVSWSAAR
jgi:ATP-binding cassette, subfamily B, bacterial